MTPFELAVDDGGLAPVTGLSATGLPTWVPPVLQVPPFAVTWLGVQMKKVSVPVTFGPPPIVAVIVALSVTVDPKVVLVELGAVSTVVGI